MRLIKVNEEHLNPLMVHFMLQVRMVNAIIVYIWQHPFSAIILFPWKWANATWKAYHTLVISVHSFDKLHNFFKWEKEQGQGN